MTVARLAVAIIASGCSLVPFENLETQADRLRDAAMNEYAAGKHESALDLIGKSFEVARPLPAASWRVVENYDDAGLYYYVSGQWEQSARYQAIAVLLAHGTRENATLYPDYVGRLEWAFAKYRPKQDFTPISRNPVLLLDDPALRLRDNRDIQRRYCLDFSCF